MAGLVVGSINSGSSGDKDYLYATMSSDYTTTLVNGTTAFPFDEEAEVRGDLSLDTTTNVGRVSGLKANQIYRITAVGKAVNAAVRINFQFYDVTNSAWIGVETATYVPEFNSSGNTNQPVCDFIFKPTVDTEIEFRVRNASVTAADLDSSGIGGRCSFLIIQEL